MNRYTFYVRDSHKFEAFGGLLPGTSYSLSNHEVEAETWEQAREILIARTGITDPKVIVGSERKRD